MLTSRRAVTFPTWQDKAAFLDGCARAAAAHPDIAALGERFARDHREPRARAVAIHRFVRDSIRYQPDQGAVPGREQIAHPAVVLARGWDDCDGKAGLFVALATAAGLPARIRPVAPAGLYVHVQAEVWTGARWELAELILDGVELGQGVESARLDARGLGIVR